MKILSIRQPWASLLLSGAKTIETRTWATKFRGQFGIHAGLQVDQLGPWHKIARNVELPRGAVIGTAILEDCRPMTKADEEASLCEWSEGRFSWVVSGGIVLPKPVPMKGRLGFFEAAI